MIKKNKIQFGTRGEELKKSEKEHRSKEVQSLKARVWNLIKDNKDKFYAYELAKKIKEDTKISHQEYVLTRVHISKFFKDWVEEGKIKSVGWEESNAPIARKMYEIVR